MRVRSPLQWVGGKHYQAPMLIQHLNQARHLAYVEVFGGGGSVLIKKDPVDVEVYNDLDGSLVNFWMQVRTNPDALQASLDSLPYSRSLLRTWAMDMDVDDGLESAVRFFYRNRASFSGRMDRVDSFSAASDPATNRAEAFRTATGLLSTVSRRFRYVNIEESSFDKLIPRYDGSDVLFYLDPPYVEEGASCYRNGKGFGETEHREMARLLNDIEGFAAVSYYPHPLITELYPGWRFVEYEHIQSAANGPRDKASELLLLNYDEDGKKLFRESETMARTGRLF